MRFTVTLASFAIFLFVLSCFVETDSAIAGGKKKDPDDAKIRALEAKVRQLQQQLMNEKRDDKGDAARLKDLAKKLADREKHIDQLEARLKKETKDDKSDDAKIKELTKKLADKEAELKKKGGSSATAVVHSMIFRVKEGADEAKAQKALEDARDKFKGLNGVVGVWFGKPSKKGASDADKNYQFGMVVVLDSAASLQPFLQDAQHRTLEKTLEKVSVYDFQK